MWLMAVVLVLLFAAIGFFKGAIRMAVAVAGLFLAIFLAGPVGAMLKPILPSVGVKNPVYLQLLPPAIAFILLNLVFITVSFFVHHKVALHYKYRRDDVDRLRWERLNRRVGAACGVLVGVVFFFLLGAVIYSGGYITTQISNEENNPALVKFMNNARKDMDTTGMDKAMATIAPASPRFYQAADVLGLLYHNPLLQARLANYPYFLSLGQRPEFQEIATDKEYNDLIFGKAPITDIIKHPRTEGLMNTPDIMDYLKGADLADLKEYLKTGKSLKYAEEEILGVWNLDKDLVFTHMRKMFPDMKARDLTNLKKAFEFFPTISIAATPDNKIYFKSDAVTPEAAAAATPPPVEDPMAARYGAGYAEAQRRAQQGQQPPQAAPAPAAPAAVPQFANVPKTSGEGAWKEEAGQYILSLPGPSGQSMNVPATIKEDELVLQVPGMSLVFIKQEV